MAPIQVFSLRTSSPPHFNPKSGHKATSSVAHPTVCTQHPRSNQHFWELISLLPQWDHSSKSACPCSCKGIIKVWAILRPSPHSTWMMLFSALAFGTSAASGFLWGSREQNMSPSSHLLSENSWKLRLKTALPLGFTFLCLSIGVTGASCLEQPPGTTQALAADHRLVCLKYFPDIPFLWKDSQKNA